MEISENERLILSYLLEILAKLEPEKGYEKDLEVINRGYELHYDTLFGRLSKPIAPEKSKFVLDVLSMYRGIYYSNKNLDSKEKFDNRDISFPGFDSQDEIEYMVYCRYFIQELDRFQDIKEIINGTFECGSLKVKKYESMLKKYEEFKKSQTGHTLSKDVILDLINLSK
jgi:uncharacterized protein YfbU (UPF0304 family)